MSSSSVQSFVGINYDPRSKLIQIRYKLYPQKISWGIRYNPKFKPFDDLLELLHLDLVQYASEDLTELSANKQKESEEPEDLEAREIRESSAELEDEFNRS